MATALSSRNAMSETSVENIIRRAALVTFGVMGVVIGAVVGFVLLDVVGLVVGVLVVGGAAVAYATFEVGRVINGALEVVMGHVASRKVDAAAAPRLFNLLEGLCAVSGVHMPTVSVTNDDGINALTAADPARERSAELVVTKGLVESLERIEMEGVVAVCLARLRSGAAESGVLVASLMIDKPWFLTSSTVRRIADFAHGGSDVFDADVKGAGITRYPPGLAAAYQRMIDTSTRVSGFDVNLATLWVADPSGESNVAGNSAVASSEGSRVESPIDSRPPLHERLALLREI